MHEAALDENCSHFGCLTDELRQQSISQHQWVFRELLQSCVIPSTSFCSPIDPPPAFVLLTIPRSPAARAAAVPPSHGAVIVL